MKLRSLIPAAFALLLVSASSAFAQGSAYGVSSNVSVLGLSPGSGHDHSNGLPLDDFELRELDPAGVAMGTTPNNTVFADAAARGWAQPGLLRVKTDAAADPLSARTFSNSSPYGSAEVRFWDTVTVTSGSLPAGTPVTLVFANRLNAELAGSGAFAATFYASHTIGGRTVASQQTYGFRDGDYSTELDPITVNTQVGARFTMSGKLSLVTHAYYYGILAGGQTIFGGQMQGDLSLEPLLDSASGDAYLVADSGAVYHPAAN